MIHNVSKSTISSWFIITSKFVARFKKKKKLSKHIYCYANVYFAFTESNLNDVIKKMKIGKAEALYYKCF